LKGIGGEGKVGREKEKRWSGKTLPLVLPLLPVVDDGVSDYAFG
jgi:hypothetical protein